MNLMKNEQVRIHISVGLCQNFSQTNSLVLQTVFLNDTLSLEHVYEIEW
jgi:hypothetical protein